MMALLGVGSGFFNTPNQAAIIGSVPREYRGFATGMVQTVFGISALLGISLGGVLLTLAFRYYAGIADATPSAAHPRAFVASMNVAYGACLALAIGANRFSADSVGSLVNAGTSGPGPLSPGHRSCPSKNHNPSLAIITSFPESLPARG